MESDVVSVAEMLTDMKFVIVVGNGGSASTASHFASDLSKLKKLAYCFTDNPSTITALTNDYSWDELYVQQYRNLPFKPDAVIIFSVHGGEWRNGSLWSKNLVDLARIVKQDGVKVISITGNDGGILREISDFNINVDSDNTSEIESEHGRIAHQLVDEVKSNIEKIESSNITSTVKWWI